MEPVNRIEVKRPKNPRVLNTEGMSAFDQLKDQLDRGTLYKTEGERSFLIAFTYNDGRSVNVDSLVYPTTEKITSYNLEAIEAVIAGALKKDNLLVNNVKILSVSLLEEDE